MQAAFIDIGLGKAGFIHASEVFGGPLPLGMIEDATKTGTRDEEDLLSEFDLAEPDEQGWTRKRSRRSNAERKTSQMAAAVPVQSRAFH